MKVIHFLFNMHLNLAPRIQKKNLPDCTNFAHVGEKAKGKVGRVLDLALE